MKCLKALVGVLAVAGAALVVLGGTASANPLTSPAGTYYSGTLQAEAESTISLTGPFGFGTVSCKKSTFEAKVESSSVSSAIASLSSLTFGECSGGEVTAVTKPGSLQIEQVGAGKATVRWSGAEIKIHKTLMGSCTFTSSNTDIGTLTGSSITGGNATLDFAGQLSSSNGCGTATLDGSYKFTTPNPLYVDEA
jgi:hypothetical protein